MRIHSLILLVTCSVFVCACQSDTISGDTPWQLDDARDQGTSPTAPLDMKTSTARDSGVIPRPRDQDKSLPDASVEEEHMAPIEEPLIEDRGCVGALPPDGEITPPDGDVTRASFFVDPRTGCPHLSYQSKQELHYTWWDRTTWRHEVVPLSDPGHENALWIDAEGKVHIAAEKQGEKGLFLLEKSRSGAWTQEKIFDGAWIWGIESFRQPDESYALHIRTASGEYQGSDMALHAMFQDRTGTWKSSLIIDDLNLGFGIGSPIEFDEQGRASTIISLGEGGRINDPERPSNIMLIQSAPHDLTRWTRQRIGQGLMIEAGPVLGTRIDGKWHVFTTDRHYLEQHRDVMVHMWQDDTSTWQVEPFQACEVASCRPLAIGRLRAEVERMYLFHTGSPYPELHVHDGMYWHHATIGTQADGRLYARIDPFDELVHTVITVSPEPHARRLRYTPLSLISFLY